MEYVVLALLGVFRVQGSVFEAEDSVHYRIEWKPYSQMPEDLRSAVPDAQSNQPFVFMSNGGEHKYVCTVPKSKKELKSEKTSYSGPSPAQLIEPLHTQRICSYWLDVYWTYELCHGRYIQQFHEDPEANQQPRLEFYLGNYARDQAKLEEKTFNEHSPPVRKVDDRDLAYFPVTYKQGTVCDLTGKPRTTTVLYVCKQGGKDGIYSSAEVSTCNYEMVVLTERLCSHPTFRPVETPEYEIVCYSRNPYNNSAKLPALIQMENEDATAFEREYSLIPPQTLDSSVTPKSKPAKPSSLQLEREERILKRRKALTPSESDEEDDEEADEDKHTTASKTYPLKPEPKENEGPSHDPQGISRENINLLSGRDCLYGGGAGWWKYEFCYGRSVVQYHSDQTGRHEILLGRFNAEIHKQWIEHNPQKRPVKIGGKVQSVFHIYSGGDICDEAKVHRSVVVNIRCRHSEGSQTAVTLSLTEPSTCQYVLRVESPRFCDILQQIDEYGLVKLEDVVRSPTGSTTSKASKLNVEL